MEFARFGTVATGPNYTHKFRMTVPILRIVLTPPLPLHSQWVRARQVGSVRNEPTSTIHKQDLTLTLALA